MKRLTLLFAATLALLPLSVVAQEVGEDTIAGETKSPIETWQGLVALVIPLVVGFIIQKGWSKGKQTATMVVIAFITAVVGQYLTDGWDGFTSADPVLTFLKIVTLTQAAYATVYQAIPLPQLIESKTGGDSMKVQDPYRITDKTGTSGEVVRKAG